MKNFDASTLSSLTGFALRIIYRAKFGFFSGWSSGHITHAPTVRNRIQRSGP
jgi:hypothetical protein